MSYRDLIAWQKGMELVKAIYETTDSFPQHEMYGLTSQLRRAAVSIPSNIAEGQAHYTNPEFVRFLRMLEVRSLKLRLNYSSHKVAATFRKAKQETLLR